MGKVKDREEKALRFLNLCAGRFGSERKEDYQIADELGFRSPAMLYKQLELDGSPVCGVCGQLYATHRGATWAGLFGLFRVV
jgi:hypothetical protein